MKEIIFMVYISEILSSFLNKRNWLSHWLKISNKEISSLSFTFEQYIKI